jgi:FkbM family methyltransferase
MLRQLHGMLTRNRFTSRVQRRIVHQVKDLVGCPDAYFLIGQIYQRTNPVAVLDIGSHQGNTVLKILDYIPQAKIHAFEPTPSVAAILRQRMQRFANVTVHELAVSDKTGVMNFFLNSAEQSNSLLDNASSENQPFEESQQHLDTVQIQATSLDEWASKHEPSGPLIVKADIQGAERLLIAGGRRTFCDRVTAFYSEVCLLSQYKDQTTFWELNRILTEEMNFALFDIYPCGKDSLGRAAWTDAMWIKKDVLPITP